MPAVTWDKEVSEFSSEGEHEDHPCIAWSGHSKKIPVLLFFPEAAVSSFSSVGERFSMAFKIVGTESRLVRGILTNHGFHEVPSHSDDFDLMWTGSQLAPSIPGSFKDFQKVNHFPRSYELTRKDHLYRNIQRMQKIHGFKNFHIIPQAFVLPSEYQKFRDCFAKDKGLWIIKPVASSRGRGIYLVENPCQISVGKNTLVSRYLNNPLLIDGFKFDLRLYVLVTSYDPLIVYLYEEGLARFATVKYDCTPENIEDTLMHLTNSSLNKKSSDYVRCDDPEVEDYGSKWSMSAVLRYLKQEGKDTTLLMRKVEDLIIKAVLSARLQIANTCKKSVPHRTNCFELYGFDVLIDSKLKPWLIEVNLSPSLTCDAPLDLKIKANMIADMFSLVGFVCQDPLSSHPRSGRVTLKHPAVQKVQGPALASNSETEGSKDKPGPKQCQKDSTPSLTAEEIEVLHRTKEENERRGGFIRIFPTTETWALYGKYLDSMTSLNNMLANTLFQERNVNGNVQLQVDGCHAVQYERKLRPLEERKRTQRHLTHRSAVGRKKSGKQSKASPSVSSSQEGEEGEEVKQVLEPGSHKALVAEQRKQVATPLERCHGEALSSSEAAAHSARPTVNLLHILQQGWDLSKVQARVAFSSYLQRVQQRLLAESRAYTIPACPEKDNDQMELVIRFLKRAASNFQQDIKVVLPSRQLPFQDRRRILSHQLGELIHCYNKETDRMVKKQEDSKEDHFVNPSVFQEYISTASESDLEEVLTFYMQKTLPVAQEDSSASESSLFTGEVSSDPDIEVSENQPTVCALPEEQAAVRSSKTQPEVQASQHCSSSPLTLDCTHIYHQHCPPNTTSLPLHCPPPPPPLSPQPPSYTQSLARSQFCHAEGLSEPPAYASTVMVTQPPRAEWTEVSSGSHTLSTGHPTQSFTSSTPSSGAASFLLRPTPECQVIKKKKGSSIELTSLNKASRMLGEESFTPNPEVLHTAATTHQPVKAVNSGKDHCDAISHRPGKHNNGLWESQMQSAYSFMTGANRQQCHQQSQGSYQLQFAILKLQQQRLQSQQYVDQSHCRHQAPFPYQIPHFQASTNSSNCPTPGFHVQPGHSHGHSHIQTCVSPIYTPKPPSSAREEQTRKIATKRLIKQISTESSASGGVSSGQHMVYDAICSKTSLAMYQKLFQTKHPGNR